MTAALLREGAPEILKYEKLTTLAICVCECLWSRIKEHKNIIYMYLHIHVHI